MMGKPLCSMASYIPCSASDKCSLRHVFSIMVSVRCVATPIDSRHTSAYSFLAQQNLVRRCWKGGWKTGCIAHSTNVVLPNTALLRSRPNLIPENCLFNSRLASGLRPDVTVLWAQPTISLLSSFHNLQFKPSEYRDCACGRYVRTSHFGAFCLGGLCQVPADSGRQSTVESGSTRAQRHKGDLACQFLRKQPR